MTTLSERETREKISSARSFLFVPGDRPDRIGKAFDSGADAVIVDLEDAVGAENKRTARSIVAALGDRSTSDALFLIRVNAFGTSEFGDDLRVALASRADGIVVPKFVPAPEARRVDDTISALEDSADRSDRLPIIGLIESAAGLVGLSSPAEYPARVARLAFGAADFHADLHVSYQPSGIHTDHAMAVLVVASAAAGLAQPVDSPHFALDDDGGLAVAAHTARDLGFGGLLCIHPRQVAIVNAEFSVGDEERSWAERILSAWDAPSRSGNGAIRVGGELVDEAVLRRARQILQAGRR